MTKNTTKHLPMLPDDCKCGTAWTIHGRHTNLECPFRRSPYKPCDTTMPTDPKYELNYCESCGVMTNHLEGRCMKPVHSMPSVDTDINVGITSDEELRREIKKSGLYLQWTIHTDVPQSEHDRWIDVIIGIANRCSAKALHEAEVRARIDELSNVQLGYGHYVAQTFIDGQAMTIEERLVTLTAEKEGKQ